MDMLTFMDRFPDEDRCEECLITKRWPDGYVCEACGSVNPYYIRVRRTFECRDCKHQKSITAETIFHRTRTPLREWFAAIYLIAESKKGISGMELQRRLGAKDERRIYDMKAKIQAAMEARENLYVLEGHIELDDAFFGGKSTGGKRGRGSESKRTVVVAVSVDDEDRPLYAKMKVVESLNSETADQTARSNVSEGSFVVTDGLPVYHKLSETFEHEPCVMETPSDNQLFLPWVHILISNAKRFINGTHHSVKHLQRYLDEFCWRFNRRYCNLFDRLLLTSINFTPKYLLP